MTLDPEYDDQFRHEISDWFDANGVDPRTLPMQMNASIADGQITFRRKVRGPNGRFLLDPDDGPDMPFTETVSVPLLVQPPPRVAT